MDALDSYSIDDAGLLDELARCYAAAVVRGSLEGQEGDPGGHLLGTNLASTKKGSPDLIPDEYEEGVPF